jgi:probable rRNA maturation factor
MASDQSDVAISNRQDLPVDLQGLAHLARDTLRSEGVSGAELSVSLVTGREMSELHERYLGEPGPTDVLSFPLDEPDGDLRLIGDVVICPEYAAANSGDVQAELRLLLVHGILHLLGYDHEEETDRAEMWARQERYSGVAGPDREATG